MPARPAMPAMSAPVPVTREPETKKGYCTCCGKRKIGKGLRMLCDTCHKRGPCSEVLDEHHVCGES